MTFCRLSLFPRSLDITALTYIVSIAKKAAEVNLRADKLTYRKYKRIEIAYAYQQGKEYEIDEKEFN